MLLLKFLKNVKKWPLKKFSPKKFSEKFSFLLLGIPQNRKKLKNFDFSKSTENALKMILRPK